MTRYSDEVMREMYERMSQRRWCPLQYKFKDKTIEEIRKELETKNFSQEDQINNK